MKKVLSLILALLVLSMLCSCKKNTEGETDMTNSVTQTSSKNESSSNTPSSKENTSSQTASEKLEKLKNAEWRKNPENYKLIALTFDDAPCYSSATGNNTTKIIDTLNKYEGAGTLFCVGTFIENNGTELLKYALDSNFELANHSYCHQYLDTLTKNEMWVEIMAASSILENELGVTPKFYRPADGRINATGYDVTTEIGLPVMWSDVSGVADYNRATTPESIENKVVNGARDGSVILLHSQAANTAAAIENICKRLYEQGYRFVTLSELCEFKGIDIDSLPTDKKINNLLDY